MSTVPGTPRLSVRALFAAAACAALLLGGCHSKPTKTTTAKKNDKPMALVPLANRIQVREVWTSKLSGEAPKLRLGLDVAADETRVYGANHKGEVEALELTTGRSAWRHKLKAPLSAGPAVGQGLVVVGTSKGEIIALSASDGQLRWRTRINSEILSAPAIAEDKVLVRAVDGKLHGLSLKDGSEDWVVDQQVPRLSLRGTGQPTLVRDLVICGFDNGRVLAILRRNGTTAWDATVGQPHGSTELARLSDVDAKVIADGDDVFAVAFQGHVARLALESGQVVWTRDMSSYRGLAVDANAVYVSSADGDLVRVDRRNGTEQWRQKALERRQLTAPVLYGGRLVVADAGGVVHWLDPATGDFLARAMIGKSVGSSPLQSKKLKVKRRITATPLVVGGMLLVFSDAGEIEALRASEASTATTASVGPATER